MRKSKLTGGKKKQQQQRCSWLYEYEYENFYFYYFVKRINQAIKWQNYVYKNRDVLHDHHTPRILLKSSKSTLYNDRLQRQWNARFYPVAKTQFHFTCNDHHLQIYTEN